MLIIYCANANCFLVVVVWGMGLTLCYVLFKYYFAFFELYVSCISWPVLRLTSIHAAFRTGQPPDTSVIAKRRLRLFGHLARADPSQDHSRIHRAAINRPAPDWRRRAGRPRRTWLRTIELDLRPHDLGLNTAWMRAQDRSKWRQLVETAMLTDGRATRWWWW